MRKWICLVLAQAVLHCAISQDKTVRELQDESKKEPPADTTLKGGWKKGGLFTLNLAQGSLANWQGGGDKSSFSAVSFLNLFARYKNQRHAWDNSLDLGYGYINTTSLGSRKSDDRIDLLSKYGYALTKHWYASTLFNLRTQFAKGYTYTKLDDGTESRRLTSDFFSPAYAILSLGFDYKPSEKFSVFLSPLTERWIIVRNDLLSSEGAYGVQPGKHARNELGAFLSAVLNTAIMTNVIYKARLDAFSNYRDDPQNVDIFWTNILAMKINKYLTANISLDVLYDDDAIRRVQLRQLLGIGFSAAF